MKNAIILILLFLNSTFLFSQNSKKETTYFYKELSKVDINEVKEGKHLDLAKQFTVEKFITYYLDHGKVRDTKKNGIETIIQLYSDTMFTYFGKLCSYRLLDFFKVTTADLNNINLEKLDGNEIRERFIEQIIPLSDKEKVNRKENQCSSLYYNPQFTYQYRKTENEILITYQWKISCDFLYKIINNTYTAKLDLKNFTLTK